MLDRRDPPAEGVPRRRLQRVPLEQGIGDGQAAGGDEAAVEAGARDRDRVLDPAAGRLLPVGHRPGAQLRGRQHRPAQIRVGLDPGQLEPGQEIRRIAQVERRPGIPAAWHGDVAAPQQTGGEGGEQQDGEEQNPAAHRRSYRAGPACRPALSGPDH
jgi:hypothetical protein